MAAKPSASHDQQVIAAEDGSPAERMAYMDARLYTAAAKGDVITLRELISADDVLRQVTPQRNALLHIASQFGQLVSVQLILQFSSSSSLLQQPNRKGDTALHLAAREGHREVVKALIHGAKSLHPEIESDVKPDKAMMRTTNKTGGTALHEAVWYNHVQVVELLVKEDPDFTYGADSSGYTPLYIAAERGFGDLVKILIGNKSSSPAHSGILGRNALHAAVIRRDLGMTVRILAWKAILAKEVDEEGWSPLHCAAYLKDAAITKELLKNLPDKSVIYLGINGSQRTALHIATLVGSIEIVKLLLSYAPDCIEQVDAGGSNVFHLAMLKSSDFNRMGRKLLKIDGLRVRGLVNEKDAHGDTPLHLLASLGVDDTGFVMDRIVDKKARDNEHCYANEKMVSEEVFSLRTLDEFGKEVGVAFRPHKSVKQLVIDAQKDGDHDGPLSSSILKRVSSMREATSAHLVVAALVATVTFAAGFTLPGGYGGEDGTPVLSKKASFKAFVASDVIALCLSVGAIYFYFNMENSFVFGLRTQEYLFVGGFYFTLLAIAAMLIAFVTGLYAVLPLSLGLPILTSFVIVSFSTYLLFLCINRRDRRKILRSLG